MKRSDLYPTAAKPISTVTDAAGLGLCGLYVGGTGDVVLIDQRGNTATFKAVPAGVFIELAIDTVKSTANGTTATNLVGLVP